MAEYRIPLLDLVLTMSTAADLVSPAVGGHHKRVTYIAGRLGVELGLPAMAVQDLVVAAALHDIGAFSLQERTDSLEFELVRPQQHAELGFLLLEEIGPLACPAEIIRHHHVRWEGGEGRRERGHDVPELSHVLHLADRIDATALESRNILADARSISERVVAQTGTMFAPDPVEAFRRLAELECFWLDLTSPAVEEVLRRTVVVSVLELEDAGMVELARLLSHLIDFKSPFTSTHSAGVARTAEALAGLLGLPARQRHRVLLAGYLHDLGKLVVPREILEKPARLTSFEYGTVKSHAYHTQRILQAIAGLDDIATWASSHHEHLDGSGYPFHLSDLPLESRIVAVADVFTALAEDRPYRRGLGPARVRGILVEMARRDHLDLEVVARLAEHQQEIDDARRRAQQEARSDYDRMAVRARAVQA